MFTSLIVDEKERNCKNIQETYLKKAAQIAVNSELIKHKHGCVIVKDGKIISEGYNHYVNYYEHKYTIHAEVDAILKVKKMNLTDCELYVVRIGTDLMGNPLKYSKPCVECTKCILKHGIKKIYFSTNEEFNKMFKSMNL